MATESDNNSIARFRVGPLQEEPAGLLLPERLMKEMERTLLLRDWQALKTEASGRSEKDIGHELIKKDYSGNPEGIGICWDEVSKELYEDLVASWNRQNVAPIKCRRTTLMVANDGIAIDYDTFEEDWVLCGSSYLVEVEYDESTHSAEKITSLVMQIFTCVEDVTGNFDYTEEGIARRIADRRREVVQA